MSRRYSQNVYHGNVNAGCTVANATQIIVGVQKSRRTSY